MLIATSNYDSLPALELARDGVIELAAVLGNARVGGYEVNALYDPSIAMAQRQIRRLLETAGATSELLVYFSGHGIAVNDDLYLAVADTGRDQLATTSYPLSSLLQELRECPADVVVIVDCCYSAGLVLGARAETPASITMPGSYGPGRRRALLASSTEVGLTDWQARSSLFTRLIIRGLGDGRADLDGDGIVTIEELQAYLASNFQVVAGNQTPRLMITGDDAGQLEIGRLRQSAQVTADRQWPGLLDEDFGELTMRGDSRIDRILDVPALGDLSEAAEPIVTVSPVRFVNVVVAEPGTSDSVRLDQPLKATSRYDVLVNIGMSRRDSLLPPPDGAWPQDALPQGDLRLRAVLRMDGWSAPVVRAFTLPMRGESFACDCAEDVGHSAECLHDPWVRIPVTTPPKLRRWTGELAIYYQAVVVHAQRLFLPTETRASGGPRAQLIYRLTTSFANLGELADRTASILVSAAGSRVMVNGVSFVDNPVSITTGAVDDAARSVRDILYDIHLRVADGREVSRYNAEHRKSQAEFEADLRLLARAGAEVYEALFPDGKTWSTLPGLLRYEARARGRPAILCIADPGSTDRSDRHVPWSVVYDLPMGTDPASYSVCPSVSRFGPAGNGASVPAYCSVGHADADVLCLFGFWGLSCLIEQPPSANYDLTQIVIDSDDTVPVALLVVTDPGLDAAITRQHVANLKSRLQKSVSYPAIANSEELALALAAEDIDVAYLYCHCAYQKLSERVQPSVVLRLGTQSIGPLDVSKWARSPRLWPRPHWPNRKPLVVLNGCHTVDFTSATLSDFVTAFMDRAGAAGVIGTEVAVEQNLASHLMELFLTDLAAGATTGDALRDARWQLIRRGNVMGLGYTPYCLSGLRLRPQS